MKIKPLNDKIAVKYVEKEEKTESGIVLPDTATKEKPQQGEIIAVGAKCCNDDGDPVVNVGDIVVFDKYAGTEINLDGEDFIIVGIEDVLAVIE